MESHNVSLEEFVQGQVDRWSAKKQLGGIDLPVITVSMEPGSGGSLMAEPSLSAEGPISFFPPRCVSVFVRLRRLICE